MFTQFLVQVYLKSLVIELHASAFPRFNASGVALTFSSFCQQEIFCQNYRSDLKRCWEKC